MYILIFADRGHPKAETVSVSAIFLYGPLTGSAQKHTMINLSDAQRQTAKKYHKKESPVDPVEAFRTKMLEYRLDPGVIDISGNLIRFDVDKKGDAAGWYIFFHDEISAGAFGNWKTGDNVDWCSKEKGCMTDDENEKYKKIIETSRKKRKEELIYLQKRAKKRAREIWNESKQVTNHDYLLNKQVEPYGIREHNGDLVIPIYNISGEIESLQFIKPDGKKILLPGGKKKGNFFCIPGDHQTLICEGYSTGASIHHATGGTVYCAIDSGNLPATAKTIREKFPSAQITICADNDRFTPGNPGVSKGKDAALAISAKLSIPCFDGIDGSENEALKLTDFNDLMVKSSAAEVSKQITGNSKHEIDFQPLSVSCTQVSLRLKRRPKALEFIFKYNDNGLIPRGIVGVLTATGGTGKTFFLLSMAMAAAGGSNFGPINAPAAIKTLVIVGEDSQDELDRRLWDIGRGEFPEFMCAASVYGELGPLMRLDGSQPVYADAYFWLDETIRRHPGVELLILDPKSRFYGLDENNNDHATRWIQCLESLSKKYGLTIIFSHHTGKDNGDKISQGMGRGASAIVDGCRWQAGIVRMSEKEADSLGIENHRDYIVFNAPKGNYSPDIPKNIYFKRGENGVLEFAEPWLDRLKRLSDILVEIIESDPTEYTVSELKTKKAGKGVADEISEKEPGFSRKKDMPIMISFLLKSKRLIECESGNNRKVLKVGNSFT